MGTLLEDNRILYDHIRGTMYCISHQLAEIVDRERSKFETIPRRLFIRKSRVDFSTATDFASWSTLISHGIFTM